MQDHQTRQRSRRRVPGTTISVLALLIAGMGTQAHAQTWTGESGFFNLWSDPLNWQGLQVPRSAATTAITFAGASRRTPVQNLASAFSLNSLTFASGAGAFQLQGSALRFTGPGAQLVQNSDTAVSILSDVQLADSLIYTGVGSTTLAGGLTRAVGTTRESVSLTKRGTGNLVLAVPTLFDGSVIIEAGQVRLRDGLALQNASVVLNVDNGLSFGTLAQATLGNLSGSGALALGTTALTLGGNDMPTAVYSGNISGTTGSVTKAGSATTRLSGNSQFDFLQVNTGRVQLEGGSLQLGNAGQGLMVGTGQTPAVAGPVLAISNGATASTPGHTVQVDGGLGTLLSITGAGSRLNAGGVQMLVGNHAQGTLLVEGGGTLAAGTFLIMGFNGTSNGLLEVGTGGTVTANVGLLGVQSGSLGRAEVAGVDARWRVNVMGIGGFNASLRGGTGTLNVGPGGLVHVSDELIFWSANASATVNGGTLQAGRLVSDGAVGRISLLADPAGGVALLLDGSNNGSFAGILDGGGTLLKTGSGAQTLAGASRDFSGTTILRGGRLVVGHQDALRGSSVQIETDNGLSLNNLPGVVLGSLGGTGALALGATQLTVGEDNRSTVYGGVLTGTAGSWLVKKGTGTLTLVGTGSVLPSLVAEGGGAVVLDGGSLSLSSTVSFTSASARPALQLNAGGRLELRNGARVNADGDNPSSVFLQGDDRTELLIDGVGSRFSAGFQTVAERGRITVRNGGSLDSRGFLVAGFAGGSNGTITLESGGRVTAANTTLGVLPGAEGTLVATGAGTQLTTTGELALGGLNNSQKGGTGRLQVRDGARVLASQTRFWTAGSSIEIDGGTLITGGLISDAGAGRISLMPAAQSFAPMLTFDGAAGSFSYGGSIDGDGGLQKRGASTQVLAGSNTFTGQVQVLGGTLQMNSSAASEYLVGAGARLLLNERNLFGAVIEAQASSTVVYGVPTLSGGMMLGAGTHDISAVQRLVGTSIGGGVTLAPRPGASFIGVSNAGQVAIGADDALSWRGGSNTTGTLQVAGLVVTSGFSSGGLIEIASNGTILNNETDLVLAGGSRTFIGTAGTPGGSMLLSSATRLQLNGALLVNNGEINGDVHVNYGSLLKGGGVFGNVTVNDGGRFSPGNSPGTARSGDATWGAGGSLLVELAAASGTAGEQWDLWAVDGILSITSGATANSRFTISLATLDGSDQAAPLAGFDPTREWQWQIVDTTGGIVGFDPARVTLDTQGFLSPLAGGTLQLAVQDGDLYVQFAPVPEPETWAQILAGLGGLAWVVRARRREGRTAA
jgi:fibronectin-binding autotransporter adhesin